MANEFNIKNGFITSGNSFVYANLNINGILSATTISATTISSPFTTGSVIFQGSGGTLSQDNSNLFWDNANSRLGVGTNTPSAKLQLKSSGINTDVISVLNTSNTSLFRVFNGGGGQSIVDIAGAIFLRSDSALSYINSGNFAIGTSTDGGFKFDVNGTARIQGNTNIINSSGASLLTLGGFNNLPELRFINTNTKITVDANNAINFVSAYGNVANHYLFYPASNLSNTSTTGVVNGISPLIGFAPISGSASFNLLNLSNTINQTGGASGITRGVYVNPTLTSAADYRAIETTNGNVIFGGTGSVGVGTDTSLFFKLVVQGGLQVRSSASNFVGLLIGDQYIRRRDTGTFALGTNDSATAIYMFAPTNNVGINTATDAGYKLDVNGTGRIGNSSYYLTLANGGSDGGVLRVGGPSYGYAELVSYSLRLNGGHTLYGTGGTNEFGLSSQVAPLASVTTNGGAIVFKADNNGAIANRWSDFPNALAFNFIKKETSGSYTSLLSLNGSSNNIGIGTTIPSYKLDIFGTGTTAGISSNVGLNIQPVAAPIVTSLTYTLLSGSSLGVGTYYYRVTYYNAIGETSASNTIPITTLSGSQIVQLINIPTSTDTTVIGRKIYRDKLGDGSAYGVVVGTIPNNTGTTYTDSLPDSDPVFSGSFLTRPIYAKANTTVNYISVGGVRSMIADPSLTTFGVSAGAAITVAPAVTLFGANAGQSITFGAGNTLFGYFAGRNIVGGFQNVAIGEGALSSGVVSGSYNIGLGPYVLCRDGSFNIAMGYYTSNSLTGSRNVLIGSYIGSSTSSYNDAIIIGHNATPLSGTSFQINIGNTIYGRTNTGNVMIGTTTDSGYKLDVNGSSAFRGRVNIFGEAELRQDGITQIFSSAYGIFQFRGWSTSNLTAYLNAWNYEGYLNFALNVGTSSTAVASAVLELTSTTRGFLPPRMTLAQRDAISSPATGLTVYQTTNNYLSLFNGTNWQNIVSPNSAGNVLIGKTTDSGQKLQVSGDTLIQGGLTANTISAATLTTPFTTGSVIFQGSSGTLSQNNSNLFWDNTNSRLGININTPAQALEVWGTSFVSGRVGLGSSYPIAGTQLLVTGQLTGAVIAYGIRQAGYVQNDVTLYGVGFHNRLNKTGGSTLPSYYNYLATGGGSISGTVTNQMGYAVGFDLTNATNNYAFHSELTASTGVWNIYMNGSALNYLNGSLLIGTTTDAGYKLDVNGTIRGTGASTFVGVGSPNTTTWTWQNAANSRTITISGANLDLAVGSGTITAGGGFIAGSISIATAAIGGTVIKGFNNAQLDLNGDNLVLNSRTNTASTLRILAGSSSSTSKGTVYVSDYANLATAVDASAQLQVDSTIKGFLPPRMTNAQRLSIASPAVALMVYCTDSPEGLFIYKSTGWVQII